MIKPRIKRQTIVESAFNDDVALPYNLRINDIKNAMDDVYDFFYEVDSQCIDKGWGRLEDILQKQALSNLLSSFLGNSLSAHSKELVVNRLPNGHPDLLPRGLCPSDRAVSAIEGLEVKATNIPTGAVDMHGAREQDLCVFVYELDDDETKPINSRAPLEITAIFLGHVTPSDYRKNDRGELGTRTATLDAKGLERFHSNWVYAAPSQRSRKWAKRLGLPPLSL